MSRNIFLSYARTDREVAERIVEALDGRGFKVWWDFRIPSGRSFASVIAEKLEEAPAVLVLWTATACESRHVFDEATFGLEHSKLLSVRYGGDFRLPIGFGGIHTDDLTDWIENGDEETFEKVVADLTDATRELEADPVPLDEIYEADETSDPQDTAGAEAEPDTEEALPPEPGPPENARHDADGVSPSRSEEAQTEQAPTHDDSVPAAEDWMPKDPEPATHGLHDMHAAFVRETQLPPAPPPAAETGAIKWLHENLFSSWFYSLLTLLSLWLIYSVLSGVLPWLFGGVWDTSNIRECREVLQGAPGGCFSVLAERWHQLLFGITYPQEGYWRPVLAFLLLFVAAAPVLFAMLPRRMLYFTAIYPFLAYWLIWGGPILSPVFALLGFVVGYFAFDRLVQRSFATGFFGAIAAAAVTWWIGGTIVSAMATENTLLTAVPSRDMGGFMLNLVLGTVCVSLSLPIGIVLALGRQSNMPIIKWICVLFIEFVRGVPLITLLFVASVVLAYFFPPETNLDLIARVIIMITAFASAYIAEVIRGGLAALPRGQYEAADSLGLDYPQAMRLIILPQALKISIPGIVNVAVGLFKDTTLVSVISMFDLVGMIRGPILASTDWNGVYWELWSFAALLFFVVCYGISQYSQWLERQLETDHR